MKKKKFVEIEISLDNDVILGLALMAHEQDITLNQLIVNILKDLVDGKILYDGYGSMCSIYCPECGKKSMSIVKPGKFKCNECGG